MSRSSAVVNATTAHLMDRHRSAFVGAQALTAPEPRRRAQLTPMRREPQPAPALADVA